ncbi:hypothetical protein EDD86DRAFT_210979 [Gorgonomyces haynaldii]|nr:hypothetical protein EDD86DRAFT_210979 [Gorgonomyces haynaldii]
MYWDLNDILAEQTRLKCKFNQPVKGYGFLDQQDGDLSPDTLVDLPYWACFPLALENWADIDLPLFLQQKTRNDFKANATKVNLSQYCEFFYRFNHKLFQMQLDSEWRDLILVIFRERMQLIADYTVTAHYDPTCPFIHSLDQSERELYKAGIEANHDLKRWEQSSKLGDRKRKRV